MKIRRPYATIVIDDPREEDLITFSFEDEEDEVNPFDDFDTNLWVGIVGGILNFGKVHICEPVQDWGKTLIIMFEIEQGDGVIFVHLNRPKKEN